MKNGFKVIGRRLGDRHAPALTMAPSAYWKRQCFASVEADEEPVKYWR
jgi:hypothetical protein